MENQGKIVENNVFEQDINRKNLIRRERIGKILGSGLMRTIAILLTIFVSIDLFAGFVNITACNGQVFFQSVSWIALVITRFVPNIIACMAIWAIFKTAHNRHEINLLGFKALRCVIAVMCAVIVIKLIGGITMFLVNVNYVTPIDTLTKSSTIILSIVIFAIVEVIQLIVYRFVFVSVHSVVKNEKGENPMKNGKTTSVLLIVVGSLMVLNIVPIINITNEIVDAFDLRCVNVYQAVSFMYQNPISIILTGIIMIFAGIVILLFNNRKQIEK